MSKILPDDPRRVALWAGKLNLRDKIKLSLLLNRIRELYPLARLDLIAEPDTIEFYKDVDFVDQVVAFSTVDGILPKIRKSSDFVSILKLKKYDLLFFINETREQRLIAKKAGVPYRIGFKSALFNMSLTSAVSGKSDSGTVNFLNLIDELAGKSKEIYDEYKISIENNIYNDLTYLFKELKISRNKVKVVIKIVNSDRIEDELPAWFPEVLKKISVKLNNPSILLIGPDEDSPYVSDFELEYNGKIFNLTGIVDEIHQAAIINESELFISLDPDYLLVSESLNKPMIGIYNKEYKKICVSKNYSDYLFFAKSWDGRQVKGIEQKDIVKFALKAVKEFDKMKKKRDANKIKKSSKSKTVNKKIKSKKTVSKKKPLSRVSNKKNSSKTAVRKAVKKTTKRISKK